MKCSGLCGILALLLCFGCGDTIEPEVSVTRTVSGRVIADDNEAPIAGAQVRCGEVTAATDPSGFFSLAILLSDQPGHLDVISATADRFGRSSPLVVREGMVVIRLKKAFAVTGVVVDLKGKPLGGVRARVRGARVSQSPYLCASFEREARSGTDGRFRVGGISRAILSQTLTLEAEGFGTKHLPVRIIEDIHRVSVEVGTIVLGPAHSVHLQVLGPKSEPMPGTRVLLSGEFEHSVISSDDGVAVFDRLAPGRYHFIGFPRGMPRLAALVEVTGEEEMVEANLGPPSGSSLTIVVRDTSGAPIVGADVSMAWVGEIPATGADGRTTVHGLPERAVRATVRAPKGLDLFECRFGPLVPAGQEVVVTLRERAKVSGRVTRADGSPAAGATLRAEIPGVGTVAGGRSKADGTFSFHVPRGVPIRLTAFVRKASPDRLKFTIREPEFLGVLPEVIAPAAGLELSLRPLAADRSLTVRVLDPAGAPVSGAEIMMNGSGARPNTDGEGKKTFTGLVEWEVELRARFGRLGVDAVPPAPVKLVPVNQEVELRFRTATLCRGKVLLPDGSPVQGAEIELLTEDGATTHARTDGEGRFKVAGLPGRPHSLSIRYDTRERYIYRAYREGLIPGDAALEITLALSAD